MSDNDSDAPEEFTSEQGIQINEEIRKVQRENKARVVREGKERRRKWAQKITPRTSGRGEIVEEENELEAQQESLNSGGMLPNDIVNMLAAREKQVFSSDSEEEKTDKRPTSRKKRTRSSGPEAVIFKDIPPPQCLQNSLDFLKRRKKQVSRSTSVLNNSNQALRLLSATCLSSKEQEIVDA